MKRLFAAAAMAAALVVSAVLLSAPGSAAEPHRAHTRTGCARLYRVSFDQRVARRLYHGTADVGLAKMRRLGYLIKCQRNPAAKWFVRWYNKHQRKLWKARRNPPLIGPVLASWYYDAGGTACGFHATYGFASLFLPCGTRVTMRGPGGATVVATMQDHGPYISGRTFDLNPSLKAALGCGDLCDVSYHVD